MNEAARQLFPRLLAPIQEVARLADHDICRPRFKLDDLPSEVIAAVGCNREDWRDLLPHAAIAEEDNLVANILMSHLYQYDLDAQRFKGSLNEVVWPAVERFCNSIDRSSLQILWDRMINSRVKSRQCVDLMLNLARDFCEDSWHGGPVDFAEISVFENVWSWPNPLRPSEAYAVRQVLELASVTQSLLNERILSSLRNIGCFSLAQRTVEAPRGMPNPQPAQRPESNALFEQPRTSKG